MSTRRLAKFTLFFLYLVSLIPFWPFVVDDAYISYVYSRNLAAGKGLTYNGMLVEGYSNPLWTVALSPFIAMGFDPLVVARLLSIAAGIVSLLILFLLAEKLSDDDTFLGPTIGGATVAVMSPFTAWTVGGLETILLAALIVLIVYLEWDSPPSSPWFTPILILLISLTRPEAVLIFPIWLVFRLTSTHRNVRRLTFEAFLFSVPFLGFIAWRWFTYGHLLPNTAYLKLGPSLERGLQAGAWLLSFLVLRPLFTIVLVLSIVFLVFRGQRLRGIGFAGAISLGFIGFVLVAGRDWMPHHRFLAPIVPLMGLPIAYGINVVKSRSIKMTMIVLAVGAVVFECVMAYTLYRPLTREFGKYTEGLIEAGKWIERNTASDATAAVVDAGALAYYGQRRTIDILGLNNEHIAHSIEKIDVDYVLSQKPQVLQLHVAFDETGQLHASTDSIQNQLIIDHPEFQCCYLPDLTRPSNPYDPHLFIRQRD